MTAAPTPALADCRVLYVEDVESNAALVERFLSRMPHVQVSIARDGVEARELIAAASFHIVLTDLNLPDVSGTGWILELLAAPSLSGVPVVVISADATRSTIDAVMATGATDYLTKPLDLQHLWGVVDGLSSRPMSVELPEEPPPAAIFPSAALQSEYFAEAAIDLHSVREAVVACDYERVEWLAHRCRGSAEMFGVPPLVDLFRRLDTMARDGLLSGATELLDAAGVALDRLVVEAGDR
jgi:DNA-binding response OmpR family regulator